MVVVIASQFMEEVGDGSPVPILLRSTRGKDPRRSNNYAAKFAPLGYVYCGNPSCSHLVETKDLDTVECPAGHVTDLRHEAEKRSDPGGWTHSGLSLTELGRLGEEVLFELADLGELGVIDPDRWIPELRLPLDGFTVQGHGIEVKSCDAVCAARAYNPGGKKDKARKREFAAKEGAEFIIGAFVRLDFRTSTAEIHLRCWRGEIKYYSIGDNDVPFAVVDFTHLNPFVQQEEEKRTTEIPF
jgi:hypothetical protein